MGAEPQLLWRVDVGVVEGHHLAEALVDVVGAVVVDSSLSALKFEFQEPTVPNQHQPQAVCRGSEYAEGEEPRLQVATTAQQVLECSMSSLSGDPRLRFVNFLGHFQLLKLLLFLYSVTTLRPQCRT